MNMKRAKTWRIILAVVALLMACALVLTGCAANEEGAAVYVLSIQQTASGETGSTFTVTYSDGSTSEFTVENGSDGKDGADITAADLYEEYKTIYGDDLTYAEFLEKYLTLTEGEDESAPISEMLLSSARVYAEFRTTEYASSGWGGIGVRPVNTISYSAGAGVIYQMDDDYTYFVTNYHVVYNENANADNGSQFGRKIVVYLYGSQGSPTNSGNTDEDGYEILEYGTAAIECEYVGGAASLDIAVLRAETQDVLAVNSAAKAVTLADGYAVGEKAIAVGNPEDEGLSVTEGIVSVDSEYITLQTDGTARSHRAMRIDAALYEGNSGGGLFNAQGELIGLTNAGDGTNQNVNYAIPISVVKGAADNIIFYDQDGESATSGVYRPTLGVTVTIQSSQYVYDESSQSGRIVETIAVSEVTSGSIAEQMGLTAGDILQSFSVNGTQYDISRSFEVNDLLLTVRSGDAIAFTVERDGTSVQTQSYTMEFSDLSAVA